MNSAFELTLSGNVDDDQGTQSGIEAECVTFVDKLRDRFGDEAVTTATLNGRSLLTQAEAGAGTQS